MRLFDKVLTFEPFILKLGSLDPHQSERQDLDPHQSERQDLDPHQSERQDLDPHQSDKQDADPQHRCKLVGFREADCTSVQVSARSRKPVNELRLPTS